MRKEPSWKPYHRDGGRIYCSRACGMGCTRAAFEKAHRDAEALAKRMGRHWTVRVWENLGWHWEVTAGQLSLRPQTRWSKRAKRRVRDGYRASFGKWQASHASPFEAAYIVIAGAEKDAREAIMEVRAAQKAMRHV